MFSPVVLLARGAKNEAAINKLPVAMQKYI